MSNLFSSSIGRKLVMSLSGLFLITFLVIHLTLNSFLLIGDGGDLFNQAAHFMATNPLIRVMEPLLGIGFLVHIIYASILTLRNQKARGTDKYASGNNTKEVLWASKNMYILGVVILAFLVVHLYNFYVKIKLTGSPLLADVTVNGVEMENAYQLVNVAFDNLIIVIVYVVGSLALSLHLTHGFWSAFQTIGFSNRIWRKRLTVLGAFFAWIVGIGFAIIAIGQYVFF